jgi:hypothetical protein
MAPRHIEHDGNEDETQRGMPKFGYRIWRLVACQP